MRLLGLALTVGFAWGFVQSVRSWKSGGRWLAAMLNRPLHNVTDREGATAAASMMWMLCGMLACAAGTIGSYAPALHGSVAHAGPWVCDVLYVAAAIAAVLALMVFFFMRPRFLVPRPLLDSPGYVEVWTNRRARRRAAARRENAEHRKGSRPS